MRLLTLIKSTQNNSAVEYAKSLLERCERGEVIAVTAVEEMKCGEYQICGSKTASHFETAGMLLDAAVARLNNNRATD